VNQNSILLIIRPIFINSVDQSVGADGAVEHTDMGHADMEDVEEGADTDMEVDG
jgi:hypothetical protein